MSSMLEQIEQRLRERMNPLALEVIDDSAKHAGHAGARPGGQTHYTVRITSDGFQGKSRLARHRMVYDALSGLFEQGLHALAIEANAPGE